MDDLISRQAAIKTAHLPVIDDAGYEVVRVDDILALPSAQQEYEHIPADDVALKSTSDVFKSPMWWFDVLKEIEKAGYVICRKIKQ